MNIVEKETDFTGIEYDYVINNGTVIDPKTETRTIANVGVAGDKVSVITRAELKGKSRIDATNKIVCPGFVDPHSHADGQVFSAQVMANMGVTTIIIGSCGVGPFPTQSFLRNLYESGYPLNCGALTPESWRLREKAGIESPYDAASEKQIAMMADWVEQDLLEGAMGVSLGLEYASENFLGRNDCNCQDRFKIRQTRTDPFKSGRLERARRCTGNRKTAGGDGCESLDLSPCLPVRPGYACRIPSDHRKGLSAGV